MTDWDKISFVVASQPRLKVFLELLESEKTPSNLAEELEIPISHVSKALKELKEEGIVECLTPDRKKMKFYRATERGRELKVQIKKVLESEE